MFEFRIIDMPDGNQIIDRGLKTLYNTLTPVQILEYEEMDAQLYIMDRMRRRAREVSEWRRKLIDNAFQKIACFCGLV